MTSIKSLFSVPPPTSRAVNATPALEPSHERAAATEAATPGSSVSGWVSFFESLPKPPADTMRSHYLSFLKLPAPAIPLDTDDE